MNLENKTETENHAHERVKKRSETFQIARKNTIKTLLLVGLSFTMCWSVNAIIFLLHNLGFDVYDRSFNYSWKSILTQMAPIMVFLNLMINPLIYLIKYPDYQRAFTKTYLCWLRTGEKHSEQSGSSSGSASTVLP